MTDDFERFADTSDMEARLRAYDCPNSKLGSPDTWPAPLKTAVSIVLESTLAMWVGWGPELLLIYNDGYARMLGSKHPDILLKPYSEVGPEAWEYLGPIVAETLAGKSFFFENAGMQLERNGKIEQVWFTYSLSPLRDEHGKVAGVFGTAIETTAHVLAELVRIAEEKRRAFQLSLADCIRPLEAPDAVIAAASKMIGEYLRVGRVVYGTVDDTGTLIHIRRDWTDGVLMSLAGRTLVLDDFGESAVGLIRAGKPLIIDDVKTNEVTASYAHSYAEIGVCSVLALPLIKAGRLQALLNIHDAKSRHWSADEIATAHDMLDRTWSAAESAYKAQKVLEIQQTLRASEERYRNLFENIDEGFCVIEFIDGPHGPLSDYVHVEANPAYIRHSGIANIVGKTGRSELNASEADAWIATFRSVLETGNPIRFERELEATDRYLEVAGMRIGASDMQRVSIMFQDISARKRAEKKLRELNETLESQFAERTRERDRMWETSLDLMLVIGFEGYFRRVNPAWTTLLGYEAEELIGHHINEFVISDFHKANVDAYNNAAKGEQINLINCYRHKGGASRWISWTAVPDGDVIYATGRDITAEREQAAALATIEETLRQSQKMEAVGQLTGGLAHDFNNLLAGITGALQLMEIRMQQGRFNEFDRYIAMAQGASKRAAALTHRLLAFSRQQTLSPKPTNVNRLIADMHELIQRTVGPSIPIEVVGVSEAWTALVDSSQLENALLNLCINARDAMPDGGRITIETANKWLDEHAARQQSMEQGQYLSLCVTDTGTGMSKEVMARACDPFFTTKPIGQGTGLGLSMIYGFAQQSGGQVRIYSELGEGTTVCIYLPRHHGNSIEDDTSSQVTMLNRSEQVATVLIVDDEPTVRMLLIDVLEDMGYAWIEAEDSAAGLKILQSNARIDLLVSDVGLPGGMYGRQMADAGCVSRPDLKVLFITGYAENAVLNNGYLAPGMAVLTKPFSIEMIAERIRSMIESSSRAFKENKKL